MDWHCVAGSRGEQGGPGSSPQCDFCSRCDPCDLEVRMTIKSSRRVIVVCLSSMHEEQVLNTKVESRSKLSDSPFLSTVQEGKE